MMKVTRMCLLSLIVGLMAGVFGGSFRYMLNVAEGVRQWAFAHGSPLWFHLSVLVAMWGIAMFVYFLIRKVPLVGWSGIPQSQYVIIGRKEFEKPWRQLAAKYIGAFVSIGMGFSLGHAGASMMMGSVGGALVSKAFKANPTEKRYLLSSGAAAGMSAAFVAPLASTLFIIEDTLGWISLRVVITSLIACVAASLTAILFVPTDEYMAIPAIAPERDLMILTASLCAMALCAAVGGKLFNIAVFKVRKWYERVELRAWIKISAVVGITYIGCMFMLDLMSGGETELIKQGMTQGGNVWLLLVEIVAMIALTALCYATGLCGSLLLPLIVMGGLLGKAFALLMVMSGVIDAVSVGYFTLIGMSTFLVAVVRAPICGMLLVLELTGRYDIFFPLVITSVITFAIGHYLHTVPVYHRLYEIMIGNESVNSKKYISTTFEVNAGSFFDGKMFSKICIPEHSEIVAILNKKISPDTIFKPGDILIVKIMAESYEKLFRVYRSYTNE